MPPETRSGPDAGPSARVLPWDQVRQARFRRASSDEFAPRRLVIEPFALFFATRCLGITLGKQLVQGIARPRLRLNDQPAAPDCEADPGARPQVQDIEQS